MEKCKFLILGAGPSGLSFAHRLKESGEDSFIVIEKECEAGGLCRSKIVDGSPLDIGGGHFLDVKREKVLRLLFKHLPENEWNKHERISKINIHGKEVDYPLEANLWQLPVEKQIDALEAIAQAGCVNGKPMPSLFSEWIKWKLGDDISDNYMLPYNKKIWSMPLDELGTYWLYKLPSVSFRETLESCLKHSKCGSVPAHQTFYYPKKYGYGEVWKRMGNALGDRLISGCGVHSVDLEKGIVNNTWQADFIVTSIPWQDFSSSCSLIPDIVKTEINKLVSISIDVDYFDNKIDTKAQWTYEPDIEKSYHRILHRYNFLPESNGYWTETNSRRASATSLTFSHHNQWAYPVNTVDKLISINKITDWAKKNNILPIGRWGQWEHMNSDVAVELGIDAADTAMKISRN